MNFRAQLSKRDSKILFYCKIKEILLKENSMLFTICGIYFIKLKEKKLEFLKENFN